MTMKGDAEDLIAIRDAIIGWTRIKDRIVQEAEYAPLASPSPSTNETLSVDKDWKVLEALISRMKGMEHLAKRVAGAIDEDALRSLRAVNPASGLDSSPLSAVEPDDLDGVARVDKDKRQPVFVIRPEYVSFLF